MSLPTPTTTEQQYLAAIANDTTEGLPERPLNRREVYLNAIARHDSSDLPRPSNNEEMFLHYIAEHPGSSETEEKTATITQNGVTEITPTEGKAISKVTVTVAIPTYDGSVE